MGLSTIEVFAQGSSVVISTLFKHYLNRKKTTQDSKARSELLFDEMFTVMKAFLEIATKNTVEDLQQFSNTRIPAPPNILVVRILIPLSSCHIAAKYLLQALGGPEQARKIVGGQEWWQVRGIKGVEAEWIVVKKEWIRREKEDKEMRNRKGSSEKKSGKGPSLEGLEVEDQDEALRDEGTDGMRTMLYIHGGAHYWGSINTHRYTIWRYARKMKGRAFAVNYRKSPQYPFPCALQDCIAAYLYLLDPPADAKHAPVSPSQIILAGDSAGGGLVLALLQVIRDVGLPMPAGAVLISPWSDLTHCFPSTMENFATDVMPPYGFIHKPSTLWPPPTPEISEQIQKTLKLKTQKFIAELKSRDQSDLPSQMIDHSISPSSGVSTTTNSRPKDGLPTSDSDLVESFGAAWSDRKHDGENDTSPDPTKTTAKGDVIHSELRKDSTDVLSQGLNVDEQLHPMTSSGIKADKSKHGNPPAQTSEGKVHQNAVDPTIGGDLEIEIDGKKHHIRGQIQQYATNAQLPHPFISPAFAYLGGLCPLLVIASDKELLRDEILYVAHKAADPKAYPIPPHVERMLPSLDGIQDRYGPTKVHLQVYDEVCHVLPIYSMTTPAKYCFRSIASFCKFVTTSTQTDVPFSPLGSDVDDPKGSSGSNPYVFGSSVHPDSTSPKSPVWESASSVSGSDFGSRSREMSASSEVNLAPPIMTSTVSTEPEPISPSNNIVMTEPGQIYPTGLDGPLSSITTPSSSVTSSVAASPLVSSPNVSSQRPFNRRFLSLKTITAYKGGESSSGSVPGSPLGSEAGAQEKEIDWKAPSMAGDSSIYVHPQGEPFGEKNIIRERVSTTGVLRPLEPEADLPGLHVPFDELAKIKELPAKRYLTGQALWDKKFAHAATKVERERKKNIHKSQEDGMKVKSRIVEQWTKHAAERQHARGELNRQEQAENEADQESEDEERIFLLDYVGGKFNWLFKGESPPPSAVVSRRDTNEARKLAKIADDDADAILSGGANLWTLAIELLSPITASRESRTNSTSTSSSVADTPDVKSDAAEILHENRPRAKRQSFLQKLKKHKPSEDL
ncbi:Arylacetamide deacetylase [Phaffia rhodozyma]|uniref:Arylacetamide deacetylase n=1 Tax=Phaffia rhodozyma TaxID=264483 RepID=A0A0F7SF64_PHARH|nr:Arylacetamide deacetylase [Phaffia rhodozyma]